MKANNFTSFQPLSSSKKQQSQHNRRAIFLTFDCPNYYNYAIIAKYAYFLCTMLIFFYFYFLFFYVLIDSIKSNANHFTKNIFILRGDSYLIPWNQPLTTTKLFTIQKFRNTAIMDRVS